jgi:hypothetical protein
MSSAAIGGKSMRFAMLLAWAVHWPSSTDSIKRP